MKILLVHPYRADEPYHYAVPQISLGYLSATLKNNDFSDVQIIDCQLLRAEISKVGEILKKEKPDILGIKFWSSHVPIVQNYVRLARQLFGQKVKIIIGGPHPSVVPEKAMTCVEGIDFGFCGEAEEGLPLLIKKISSRDDSINYQDIPGLIWRERERERTLLIKLICQPEKKT